MITKIVEMTLKNNQLEVTNVWGHQPMTGVLGNKPTYSPKIGDPFEEVMMEMADRNWVVEVAVNVGGDIIHYHFYKWYGQGSHLRVY